MKTFLIAIALLAAASLPARSGEIVPAAVEALAPSPAHEALERIPDAGRRLLALRSYIRAGTGIAERWSWTDEEIAAFQGSPQQKALLDEVAAVAAHFAEANPGHEIYANTKVRSLDVQIDHWNSNDSVGEAGAEILAAWTAAFEGASAIDTDAARKWLSGFKGEKRSSLAAPGLTAHGQAHAIDFQVMKDGQIIAAADTRQVETVWRKDGWEEKLKQSMDAAGPSFDGPLTSPDEPWHYHYQPAPEKGG